MQLLINNNIYIWSENISKQQCLIKYLLATDKEL